MGEVVETLRTWEAERDLSGSFLVTRAGETVLELQVGYADRATGLAPTPRTRFGLASVTKLFTATAVARLVDRDRLGFHDRVVDLLPPERRPTTLRDDVTVHHLLCHTSGIADYAEEDEDSPGYLEDYADLWRDLPSYRVERPIDFLPLYGDLPPYRPPGEQWQYSNAGYLVLGLVVEEVAGAAYVDVVQREVLDVAGMADSGFFRLDEAVPDVATGHLPPAVPGGPWRTNIYSVPVVGGPDGGAFSTARDLDRFLHAHADGTLLGDQTEVVHTRHADAGGGFASGYGPLLYPDDRWGHGGGDPGVDVLVNAWPERQLHVVVLCNAEGLAGEVRDLLAATYL
jgi:CubicO group peptidase (beta-lactamase class C family)